MMMRVGNPFVSLCVKEEEEVGNPIKKERAARPRDENSRNFGIPPISRANPVFRENPLLPRILPEEIAPKPANSCIRLF